MVRTESFRPVYPITFSVERSGTFDRTLYATAQPRNRVSIVDYSAVKPILNEFFPHKRHERSPANRSHIRDKRPITRTYADPPQRSETIGPAAGGLGRNPRSAGPHDGFFSTNTSRFQRWPVHAVDGCHLAILKGGYEAF